MLLKILENKPLQRLLFKGRDQEVKIVLDDYLCKYFAKRENWLYEITPESLLQLNDTLFYLKERFAPSLGSAPLPFIFLIAEEKSTFQLSSKMRSGKIYLQNKVVSHLKRALESLSFFHKIEKIEEDLFELILPSTVDPKLIFSFKDTFFFPEEKSCLYCGTHWHESKDCPGLKIKNPLREFQNYLSLSFEDIAQKLRETLKERKIEEGFLNGFLCRHFYLFPTFLRIPFYFLNELDTWTDLYKPLDFPVRGDELYLALEELILGRVTDAENKFNAFEGEIRAELGLMAINIWKQDFHKAFYHFENALVDAKSPFLKSYLLFLKGYLNHYQRDYFSAEESYREALKLDSSCFPAYYFLHLLLYEKEEIWQKIFPFFHNPYIIYLAFLEPLFIKHQSELERALAKIIESFREETAKRLREVEDKFHKLKEILSIEEQKEYEETLKKLRDNTYKGGLILIEEASKKALELTLELNSFIFAKIKKIKTELEEIKRSFVSLEKFWLTYPYREEDSIYGQKLTRLGEGIQNIEKRLKKSEIVKELKPIHVELNLLYSILNDLEKLKEELEKKWNFRKKLYKFLVRFLTAEAILVILFLFSDFLPEEFSSVSFFTLPNFFLFSFILFLLTFLSVQIDDK